jgi:group I intron endonuclease
MILEVYKITNKQNRKIYIGITNQGATTNRWYKHCSDANCGSDFPIHNAIRKYGRDNFQVEVIEVIENQDYDYLKEREIYWIKFYDSYNRKIGYNLTLGGDGTFGRHHSEETKDKIRQKALGRKVSESAKKKMSDSHKKRIYDNKEMSDRCIRGNLIRWADAETRKFWSENNSQNRKILQYDLNMNFIGEFRSVSEASRSLGKTHQNISKCASGKIPTAYGFIWRYKE